jgi:hypothetical protein
MSDINEGPGWWKASDGKFYPPELHPSVKNGAPTPMQGSQRATHQATGARPQQEVHVGPQFPDLFQKAIEGSHLADNVSVKYDGDDLRNQAAPATPVRSGSRSPVTAGSMTMGGGGTVGEFTGASATKRRWRKAR